jgi:hypothetical protein
MSYMQELETRLKELLDAFAAGDISRDKLIGDIKLITLESYRNGIEAGKLHAHTEGVRAISETFHPSNEKRSGQAPFKKQYYKRTS